MLDTDKQRPYLRDVEPNILLVWGTRPDAIKLGPVVAELWRTGANVGLLCTGQHTTLLRGTPAETDLSVSDSLHLASDGNVARWTTLAQRALLDYFKEAQPALMAVQGDTMSAHTAAVAAQLAGLPVAHIEAGIRSHNPNEPWPEEVARTGIAQIATWHYAPTSTAFANLVAEGIAPSAIRVTGNTVVSALARYAPNVRAKPDPDHTVMVTLHRREIQTKERANWLYGAVRHQALTYPTVRFVWPMHPAMQKLIERLQEPVNLSICEPIPYVMMLALVADSLGVLTDSGGLVEEAATLGVPTVIVRDTNDRPEAVEAGIAVRVGATPAGIKAGVEVLMERVLPRKPTSAFGFADAAQQVAQHLATL